MNELPTDFHRNALLSSINLVSLDIKKNRKILNNFFIYSAIKGKYCVNINYYFYITWIFLSVMHFWSRESLRSKVTTRNEYKFFSFHTGEISPFLNSVNRRRDPDSRWSNKAATFDAEGRSWIWIGKVIAKWTIGRAVISRRARLWRKPDLSRAHIMIPGTQSVCDEYLHSLSHFCPPIVRLLRRSRSFFTHLSRCTFDLFARQNICEICARVTDDRDFNTRSLCKSRGPSSLLRSFKYRILYSRSHGSAVTD